MPLSLQADTSHIIQLSVAPAFILAAIGTTLTVLTNRLARINDRAEHRRQSLKESTDRGEPGPRDELAVLHQRAMLINASVTAAICSALFICSMIVMLFIGNELAVHLDRPVAAIFVLALLSLATTYACFLAEIYVAGGSLRADRPLND